MITSIFIIFLDDGLNPLFKSKFILWMMFKFVKFGKIINREREKYPQVWTGIQVNINEECLLKYLNNPNRLESSTQMLANYIFSRKKDFSEINNTEKKLELIDV